ncbi:Nucleoporin nup84 [Chytriomyces hyalinus]|nr:Nucleoporin nup84 [Chytriomyces hyalinus]
MAHMIVMSNGAHFVVGDEFEQFAHALQNAQREGRCALDEGADATLVKEYSTISEGVSNIESQTWHLLHALLDARTQSPALLHPHSLAADMPLFNYAECMHQQLAECIAVKKWLEGAAANFVATETRRGYRPYSTAGRASNEASFNNKSISNKSSINKNMNAGKDMDPDAPIRNPSCALARDDALYEASLLRSLFDYVRRGRLWEAMDLCRASDEPWRAASFAGALTYADAFLDGDHDDDVACTGNPNRDLWKVTCLAIAEDPAFDSYERAVYAVLAGNVQHALPVCKTWEDYVWVHYCYYLENLITQHLEMMPLATEPNEVYVRTDSPENVRLPAELFEWLSRSEDKDILLASQDPFRIIQAMIILDRIDPLLESIHQQLAAESNSISELPTVLRFIVHLIFALRSVSYPIESNDSADFIIKTYIDLLIAARLNSIVATYVAQLSSAHQIECYALFLQTIDEPKETRYNYLVQGKQCGIDMHKTCKRTVRLAFQSPSPTSVFLAQLPEQSISILHISNLDSDLSEEAYGHVRALEWLLFDPLLKTEAIVCTVQLLRRYLVHGQIHVAQRVLESVPAPKEFISKKWVKAAMKEAAGGVGASADLDPLERAAAFASVEFCAYSSLVKCFAAFVEWKAFLGMRPVRRGAGDADPMTSFEFRDWLKAFKSRTKKSEELIRACLEEIAALTPGSGGLAGSEAKDRYTEIRLIREIYATELVLKLQEMLLITGNDIPENVEKCVGLLREFVDDQGVSAGKESEAPVSFHAEFAISGKLVFFVQKHKQALLQMKKGAK